MKFRIAMLLPIIVLLSACATQVKSMRTDLIAGANNPVLSGDAYWWRFEVHMQWPENQAANWYMDLLLADQLFAPVIEEFSSQLPVWRFHRRAVRDPGGHRFAMLFYSDVDLARKVFERIEQRYSFLQNIGLHGIEYVAKSDLSNPPPPGIAAASDESWYVEIQRTWPYFIKGVSESWLHLLQSMARPALADQDIPDFDALATIYQKVNDKMSVYWRNQGGHAYLHHLNAIFGYTDVIITERKLMRF